MITILTIIGKVLMLQLLGVMATMIRVNKNGKRDANSTYTLRLICYAIALIIASTF